MLNYQIVADVNTNYVANDFLNYLLIFLLP